MTSCVHVITKCMMEQNCLFSYYDLVPHAVFAIWAPQDTGKGQHTNLLIPDIPKPSIKVLKLKVLFGELPVPWIPMAHLLNAFF